jgi:hypothetical protein
MNINLKELENGWQYNGSFIPNNENNTDYQYIKEYIAKGGEYEKFDYLKKAKEEKLAQLNAFHESKEVKYLTIKIGNLQTGIFVNQEYRYLIDEQIGLLEIRKENGEVNPTWLYHNGVSLPLDLKSLKQIRLYIGKLTDDNFRARANNIKAIQALKTLEELEKFDIATGYRINQTLNF